MVFQNVLCEPDVLPGPGWFHVPTVRLLGSAGGSRRPGPRRRQRLRLTWSAKDTLAKQRYQSWAAAIGLGPEPFAFGQPPPSHSLSQVSLPGYNLKSA
jgi:hypothetical protein